MRTLAPAFLAIGLGLAFAVSGPSGTALAQQAQEGGEATPPPAQPQTFEPSHLAAAQRLIDITRSDTAFDGILPALAARTRNTFTQSNPALAREIEETTMEVAIEMAAKRADLARVLQGIWARRFTEAELNELVEFFSSQIGQKFSEATPIITRLSLGAGQQWEEALASEMVQLTREKLREKGHLQ